MTEEDRKQTAALLNCVRLIFPECKATAQTILLYVQILDDLNFAQVQASVLYLLHTVRFFPKPAEIFEAADIVAAHLNHTGRPTPGEAWAEAMDFAQKTSPYGDYQYPFSCPEVKMAIKRFGRMALFELKTDDVNTARAQFMRIYKQCIETEKINKTMENLAKRFGAARTKNLIDTLARNKQLPAA